MNNQILKKEETKEETKEALRKKMRERMKGKQLQRSSKVIKNNMVNDYCKKNGIDRSVVDNLVKEHKNQSKK